MEYFIVGMHFVGWLIVDEGWNENGFLHSVLGEVYEVDGSEDIENFSIEDVQIGVEQAGF